MAKLVLGPLLRYVGETEAVLRVETDEPCEAEILGHREPTFNVSGHHFALVIVDRLEPGSRTEYEVALDGERRWPEEARTCRRARSGRLAPMARCGSRSETDERELHTSFERSLT